MRAGRRVNGSFNPAVIGLRPIGGLGFKLPLLEWRPKAALAGFVRIWACARAGPSFVGTVRPARHRGRWDQA